MVCLKISQLEKIIHKTVNQILEEKEAMLKSLTVEMAKLQAAASVVEEQLKVQPQELKKVMQEWAERIEELGGRLNEVSNRESACGSEQQGEE